MESSTIVSPSSESSAGIQRVLYVANSLVASLVISFFEPFRQTGTAEPAKELVTEVELREAFGKEAGGAEAAAWVEGRAAAFRPDLIVFCRYSGPQAGTILAWARAHAVPTLFHIDDDLLAIPIELGAAKQALHMHPDRLGTIRLLLSDTTLAYCSTEALRRRFFGDASSERVVAGSLYCAQQVLRPPTPKGRRIVGYMGTDHSHDLAPVVPAIARLLEIRPDVGFEIFGSTPMPETLQRFGDRVRTLPPVRSYPEFVETLASLGWTIGICALARTPFNEVKADTKWVEYTACGFAVVASRGTVYDSCCADGCGILADGDREWLAAFERLLDEEDERIAQVERAQDRLRRDYNPERLHAQVHQVFAKARALAGGETDVAAQPEALPAPSAVITLDGLRGDRLVGWAWDPAETGKAPVERQPLELWCGKVKVGTLPRTLQRPDVDAFVGDSVGPKGLLAAGISLVALWSLFGGSSDMAPALHFGGTTASLVESGPAFREGAFFRALRNARHGKGWNAIDLWWANPRLLKIRTDPQGQASSEPPLVELRVMQPMRAPEGGVRLNLVDEQAIRPGGGIVTIGVHSALMPLVLVGRNAAGHVAFIDVLPFPSLLRGGLHESEAAAMGDEGGTLADVCRLNEAYLAEQAGWGGEAPAHAIGEIAIDLGQASGAETIFDPTVRRWLGLVFGLSVMTVGGDERCASDLGDDTFVTFAESLLAEARAERPRAGRARLRLTGDAIPTVGAVVSRRRAISADARPVPTVITDHAFPARRWLVAFPGQDRLYGSVPHARLEALPHVGAPGAADPDETPDDDLAPVAIVFRDLSPARDPRLLFPVPKDLVDIPLPSAEPVRHPVSVLVPLPRPDTDLTALLASVASQRLAGGCEVLVGASNQHPVQFGDLATALRVAFPGTARAIPLEGALRKSEIVNRLASEAGGGTLVVLDPLAILHDDRTLDVLARIAALPHAGTVGCMLLKSDPKTPGAPAFRSAGLFPARIDFTLAPHVALAEPDCSQILPLAVYPVAANSGLCFAVSTPAWREIGGLAAATFPNAAAEVDLAIRFARAGRHNLCTTKVSVLVEQPAGVMPTRDIGVPSHLGLRHILPALQRSTILRSF